jgi:hypothetical protein
MKPLTISDPIALRRSRERLRHMAQYSTIFLNLGTDSELWDEWEVGRLSRNELKQLGIFLGMTRGVLTSKIRNRDAHPRNPTNLAQNS